MVRQEITSVQNQRVKLASHLHDKRQRDREGLFVVDSGRDLRRALDAGYVAEYVLYCHEIADDDAKVVVSGMVADYIVYDVPIDVLKRASYRQNPSGIVGVIQQKDVPSLQQITDEQTHLLCLVDLRKPGNIGALLRTADAAGMDAVVLIDTTLDLYNPNIIRSSTGSCFLPTIYQGASYEAITLFHERGYQIVSAHLDGRQSLFDIDLQQKSVVVMGTEAAGLPDVWVEACHQLAKIPMMGSMVDSLNVSVAGAVFMYELLRQKQLRHKDY